MWGKIIRYKFLNIGEVHLTYSIGIQFVGKNQIICMNIFNLIYASVIDRKYCYVKVLYGHKQGCQVCLAIINLDYICRPGEFFLSFGGRIHSKQCCRLAIINLDYLQAREFGWAPSVRPKPLFWFRSNTETQTQIGRYFRPLP